MKTAPRHPSPNGLVERSVRIFKDGMKKWAHGRLRVSYLFVRWIAPVTRTLQLFHATTLILNRIISTSLTNSFPARANTWMLQKSRDSSRHLRLSQLVKSRTSLTSSSIKQCGVSLWLSQVEIFLPNEQASETVDSLQQQNYSEFWEMQLAAQHDCIAQDYHERKISVNVSQQLYPLSFSLILIFFFFKGHRVAHVIWVTAQSQCAVSVSPFMR